MKLTTHLWQLSTRLPMAGSAYSDLKIFRMQIRIVYSDFSDHIDETKRQVIVDTLLLFYQ